MTFYQSTYLLTYDNDCNTIRNEIRTQQLLAGITYITYFEIYHFLFQAINIVDDLSL